MQLPPRVVWAVLGAAVAVSVGIVLNPWLETITEMLETLVIGEVIVGLAVIVAVFIWGYRTDDASLVNPPMPPRTSSLASSLGTLVMFTLIVGLWLLLYRDWWLAPQIKGHDDEHYLRDSADWATTRANLIAPYNEHMVVPTRLMTYLLIRCSSSTFLPVAMAMSTVVLFLIVNAQLFLLARREWHSDFAGLLAVCMFALTTSYRQVIVWYSASQWLFAVSLLLLSLAVAQRPVNRIFNVRAASLFALGFAGPFTYSIGVLVGPITSCFLAARTHIGHWRHRMMVIALPTLGTLAAFVIIVPILSQWFASEEYSDAGGRGALETFDPLGGMVVSAQFAVDLAFTRVLDLSNRRSREAPWMTAFLFPLIPVLLATHCRFRPRAWRHWPLVAMIVLSYGTTVVFRTYAWEVLSWTRYQLLPQLAFALLLTGILTDWNPRWLAAPNGRLSWAQAAAILLLAGGIAWVYEGRAVINS